MARKREMDNLAKDAAAALAAGMSYGKWKAMQGEPVQTTKPNELLEGWKVCPQCGKAYKPKKYSNNRQIYCEVACQKAAQRVRDKGKYDEYYRTHMREKRAKQKACGE